jgi:hypothetical protein
MLKKLRRVNDTREKTDFVLSVALLASYLATIQTFVSALLVLVLRFLHYLRTSENASPAISFLG